MSGFSHGESAYNNHRCRCAVCTVGHRDRVGRDRQRRRLLTAENGGIAPAQQHNASTYANWGCRCDTCTVDNAAVRGARRRREGVAG